MQLIIRTPPAQGEVTRNTELASQQGILGDAAADEGTQARGNALAAMPDTGGLFADSAGCASRTFCVPICVPTRIFLKSPKRLICKQKNLSGGESGIRIDSLRHARISHPTAFDHPEVVDLVS